MSSNSKANSKGKERVTYSQADVNGAWALAQAASSSFVPPVVTVTAPEREPDHLNYDDPQYNVLHDAQGDVHDDDDFADMVADIESFFEGEALLEAQCGTSIHVPKSVPSSTDAEHSKNRQVASVNRLAKSLEGMGIKGPAGQSLAESSVKMEVDEITWSTTPDPGERGHVRKKLRTGANAAKDKVDLDSTTVPH